MLMRLTPLSRHVATSSWQPALFRGVAGTFGAQKECWAVAQRRCLVTQASGKAAAAAADDADDADAVGDLSESDEFLDDLEELEMEVGPEVSTGNLDWGERALAVARQLLAEQEAFADIELFSLRAIASGKRLDIRLDNMTDLYGSPSLDDIEAFSRAFNAQMEALLGEAAGEIEVEVSSPGAERAVRIPGELDRFAELPMKVEFRGSEDPEKVDTRVLELESYDPEAGLSRWRLADVRVNRQQAGKGRGLTKKQREQVLEIPVGALRRVNLHLDL